MGDFGPLNFEAETGAEVVEEILKAYGGIHSPGVMVPCMLGLGDSSTFLLDRCGCGHAVHDVREALLKVIKMLTTKRLR